VRKAGPLAPRRL